MKLLLLLLILISSLQIEAKEHAILGGRYSIEIPDNYAVKVSTQGDEATVVVARSGRNPLSGINIVIYHVNIVNKADFEKNAQAYFASLKKGFKKFQEAKQIEGDVLSYKASGTINYKGVEYSMDAYANQYKNAVFYNLLYNGDEDRKLLNSVLSTFRQKK